MDGLPVKLSLSYRKERGLTLGTPYSAYDDKFIPGLNVWTEVRNSKCKFKINLAFGKIMFSTFCRFFAIGRDKNVIIS